MAIADTIQSMYDNVGEVYDTITNVDLPTNKNIQNIPSTMRSSYLEIMNNGTEKIWNNWDKATGEGETLTLNNTEEAPMKIDLKGNTSQEGTPTPDAPQDIHVVSGDNEINVCGKNLFNKATITENQRLDPSGGKNYDENCDLSDYIKIQPNTIYTRNITASVYECICFYTIDKTFISRDITHATTTSPNNAYYVRISCYKTNLDTLQLEKGNQATTYQEYKGASYPISLGVENLLQNNLTSGTNNGITYVVNEDKSVTLNGTATAITWLILNSSVTLEAGTYTMTSGYSGNDVRVYSTGLGVFTLDGQRTVTKTSSVSGDVAINIPSGTICNNLTIKPMIEKGTKANSYTPYGTTPIELCKIGDYQDSIVKDNGKWYLNKQIGKVVLDGSESWSINTSYTYNVFYRTLDNYARISNVQTTYCEYYKGIENTAGIVDFGNNYNNSVGVRTANDNIKDIYISNNSITSASDFKTWLSTHNTIVYYVLANPTYTEITDTTLQQQLNALEKARSYNSQTNLTQTNDDKPFILDVTALKQLTQ